MKISTILACASLLALAVPARPAEDEVQLLQRQLQQMQEDFAQTRQQQQQQIDALTRKLDELTNRPPPAAAEKPAPAKNLEQELASEMTAAAPAAVPAIATAPAHAGSAYMNLSYGAAMAAP